MKNNYILKIRSTKKNHKKFIIGNMNKEHAEYFLEYFMGVGFDEISAQKFLQLCQNIGCECGNYKLKDLSDRWCLDVGSAVREGICYNFNAEKNAEKIYSCIVGSRVLEEVCHTAGYKHYDGECNVNKFFIELIMNNDEIEKIPKN